MQNSAVRRVFVFVAHKPGEAQHHPIIVHAKCENIFRKSIPVPEALHDWPQLYARLAGHRMFDCLDLVDPMTRPFQVRRTARFTLIGAAIMLLTLMVATQSPRVELLTRAPGTPNPRFSFLV